MYEKNKYLKSIVISKQLKQLLRCGLGVNIKMKKCKLKMQMANFNNDSPCCKKTLKTIYE